MERRTRAAKREQWRRRIEQWQQSGLTAVAFAAQRGLNVHSLRRWKYLLASQPPDGPRGTVSSPPSALASLPLIELRTGAGSREDRFELKLGAGRVVLIPPTFEAEALRRLLTVLREVA